MKLASSKVDSKSKFNSKNIYCRVKATGKQ